MDFYYRFDESLLIFLDERHIGIALLALRKVDPRKQAIQKQSDGIVLQIDSVYLVLRRLLLVVADVVQIYPIDSI